MSEKVERTWLSSCRACLVRFFTRDIVEMLDNCPICNELLVDFERTKVSAFFHLESEARVAQEYPANVTYCTRYFDDDIEFFIPGTSHGRVISFKTKNPFQHEWVRLVPELRNAYLEGENDEQSDT